METPICDFVAQYAKSDALRLHMPGHKGYGKSEAFDITEIDGADVLYHETGLIKQSEENAASLFGAAKTLYSTEGSSLCIRAMLYLAMLYAKANGNRPLIAAGRNAHKTFMTAAALLDLDVLWLYPEKQAAVLSCEITAEALERTLCREQPCAVYVTSPDYLGNRSDLSALSAVCQKHGVLLLVDNAHGAYLRFLPKSLHPMDLGADMCCDSAHKTLPVLTGGAYLHISAHAPKLLSEQASQAMQLFASTSPSYLILQSLDAANKTLSEGYRADLAQFAAKLDALKSRLPFSQVGDEALKLTLAPKDYGYTGQELSEILQGENIVCEFADPDFAVMMFTPQLGESALERVERALLQIERRDPILSRPPLPPRAEKRLSIREALFAPSCELPLSECLGRTLASCCITCPPAVPILVCGERIDAQTIACMQYYGIKVCRVTEPSIY